MNKYEQEIVGYYEVGKYESIEKTDSVLSNMPRLKLNSDRSFQLSFNDSLIKGKWQADDYGDFTLVDFLISGKKAQGKVIGSETQPEIEIPIPAGFYCPFLKSLIFKRIR
jgi:hypothetical protein